MVCVALDVIAIDAVFAATEQERASDPVSDPGVSTFTPWLPVAVAPAVVRVGTAARDAVGAVDVGLLPVKLTTNEPAPAALAFGVVQVSVAARTALLAAVGVKRTGNAVLAPAATDTGNVGTGLKLNSAALAPPNVHPDRFSAAVFPAAAVTVVDCVAVGVPTVTPVKVNASGRAV